MWYYNIFTHLILLSLACNFIKQICCFFKYFLLSHCYPLVLLNWIPHEVFYSFVWNRCNVTNLQVAVFIPLILFFQKFLSFYLVTTPIEKECQLMEISLNLLFQKCWINHTNLTKWNMTFCDGSYSCILMECKYSPSLWINLHSLFKQFFLIKFSPPKAATPGKLGKATLSETIVLRATEKYCIKWCFIRVFHLQPRIIFLHSHSETEVEQVEEQVVLGWFSVCFVFFGFDSF